MFYRIVLHVDFHCLAGGNLDFPAERLAVGNDRYFGNRADNRIIGDIHGRRIVGILHSCQTGAGYEDTQLIGKGMILLHRQFSEGRTVFYFCLDGQYRCLASDSDILQSRVPLFPHEIGNQHEI